MRPGQLAIAPLVVLAATGCVAPERPVPPAPASARSTSAVPLTSEVIGVPQTQLSPQTQAIARCAATTTDPDAFLDCVDPHRSLAPAPAVEPVVRVGAADVEDGAASDLDRARARQLYQTAEQLAAVGRWVESVQYYVEAYWLVPGKHGLAHKVVVAAWNSGNCDLAKEYAEHFLRYADPIRYGGKLREAKQILGEIAVTGCATR